MSSCVWNIRTKDYQNLIIGFQVTVENVRDVLLRHSVQQLVATAQAMIWVWFSAVWLTASIRWKYGFSF